MDILVPFACLASYPLFDIKFVFTPFRYYLQFEARQGMRIFSDVAIDDFSLSPECFGLNIALEHLQGYNYYDQRILQDKTPHEDFANRSGLCLQFSIAFLLL